MLFICAFQTLLYISGGVLKQIRDLTYLGNRTAKRMEVKKKKTSAEGENAEPGREELSLWS